jgi:hypothetical protein
MCPSRQNNEALEASEPALPPVIRSLRPAPFRAGEGGCAQGTRGPSLGHTMGEGRGRLGVAEPHEGSPLAK